ncbi:uncharacterized protein ACWYII_043362 isoform 2-T6 [Salvelinus alpinus]
MTKLQFLNVYLTERLMLAAQDIYKQVEETILEYKEEIFQGKRENDKLRRKLHENGIPWPDLEPFSPVESEEEEEEEEGAIGHKQEPNPGQTLEKQDGRARREKKLFRGLAPLSRFTPSNGNDDYDQNPPQPTSHQFQIQTHTGKTIEGGFLSSSTTSNPIKTETDRLGVCPLDDPSSDPNTFSSGNLDLLAAQSENSDYENTNFWCCAVWKESMEEVEDVFPSTWVVGKKVISPPVNGRKVLKDTSQEQIGQHMTLLRSNYSQNLWRSVKGTVGPVMS